MIDIERVREDTPGVRDRIHLNNAGASLPPEIVLNTTVEYLQQEARVGGYELGAKRSEDVQNVYKSVAQLIGADADQISRAENATRAWDMAFYSVDFQKGDRLLTTYTEYCSNYVAYLHLKQTKGLEIIVVDDDSSGQIDLGVLESELRNGARMVSINHIPTNSGLVNPAEDVGKLTSEYGALYLLDACQSVGQKPLDVSKLHCDFLSATGRKFLRAPRGTGFLYVNPENLEDLHPPIVDAWAASYSDTGYELHKNRSRFESFEFNYANFLGLGAACDYALDLGIDSIWDRVQALSSYLRGELSKLQDVKVQDLGELKSGIVTFSVRSKDHIQLRNSLIERGINVSVTMKANSYLDMNRRGLDSLVRASIHYYNTREEVDHFIEVLSSLISA